MKWLKTDHISLLLALIQTVIGIINIINNNIFMGVIMLLFAVSITTNFFLIRKYIKYKTLYSNNINNIYSSVHKYLDFINRNTDCNPLMLPSVDIKYLFTSNKSNSEFIDAKITYIFEGVVTAKELSSINFKVSLAQSDSIYNVKLNCIDQLSQQDIQVHLIEFYNRVALYKIPLSGLKKKTDNIKMSINVDWKGYSLKSCPDLTLIDPQNYANEVGKINIDIINNVDEFNISQVTMYRYEKDIHTKSGGFVIDKIGNNEFLYTIGQDEISDNKIFAFALERPSDTE